MPEQEIQTASSFYFPISKVDEDQRMVWGFATTPTKDLQGEKISNDAVKKALPDYMRWRNVREMHRNSAVGVAKELNLSADGLYIGAKISDDTAWQKVKDEVYKGFSVGGERLAKVGDVITDLRITEISLVDRPANPDCRIEVFKVADANVAREGDFVEGNDDLLADPDIRKGFTGWLRNLVKREFSDDKRKELAGSGKAMPDGSFPIVTEEDLRSAIRALAGRRTRTLQGSIKARAKEMGHEDALPDDWKEKKMAAAEPIDVQKGMNNVVAPLANLMQSLGYIKQSLMNEAQWEGDKEDEAFAGRVKDLMGMVGDLIMDHTKHELKEKDDADDAAATGVMAMAEEQPGSEALQRGSQREAREGGPPHRQSDGLFQESRGKARRDGEVLWRDE